MNENHEPWADRDWLGAVCRTIISRLPRQLVRSKTELTTRLFKEVGPSGPSAERSLAASLTSALTEAVLPGLRVVRWQHPEGAVAHAVVLNERYPTDAAALAVLDTDARYLRSLPWFAQRGKLAEESYAATFRRHGLEVVSYTVALQEGGGRLDRAVDLAIVESGELRVGIEVKNFMTRTLCKLLPKHRDLAEEHRSMGAVYAVSAPSIAEQFSERLDDHGGRDIETGCYIVGSDSAREGLLRLGVPFEVVAVTPANPVLPTRIADPLVARVLDLIAEARNRHHSLGSSITQPHSAALLTEGPNRRFQPASDRYREAMARFRTGRCMACGDRLWIDRACVTTHCRLHGHPQGYERPRQKHLAEAVGVTDRHLRSLVKSLGESPPWKSPGRPSSENRKSLTERGYVIRGGGTKGFVGAVRRR